MISEQESHLVGIKFIFILNNIADISYVSGYTKVVTSYNQVKSLVVIGCRHVLVDWLINLI